MISFFKEKSRIVLLCLFVLLTCTACSNPKGSDGKTKVTSIIAAEDFKIEKGRVNTTDIDDEDLKKEYAKLDDDDLIEIKATSYGSAWKNGWFEGLIVWPLAQLINTIAGMTDAGWGIIITTILIQTVVFLITRKSQMGSQKMQEIQPELQKIQDKYAGRDDEQSRMRMYNETQAVYKKYDIHPFGSIAVMFLQLPIMMGMYYATMRSAAVLTGEFMGVSFEGTPASGFASGNVPYIVIYVSMVILSFLSMSAPQILGWWERKHSHEKRKDYKASGGTSQNTMTMTMLFSTGMISFLYLSWPIAMSFYWLVTSIINLLKSIVIHNMMKKEKK